jgi:hypothetical protein
MPSFARANVSVTCVGCRVPIEHWAEHAPISNGTLVLTESGSLAVRTRAFGTCALCNAREVEIRVEDR